MKLNFVKHETAEKGKGKSKEIVTKLNEDLSLSEKVEKEVFQLHLLCMASHMGRQISFALKSSMVQERKREGEMWEEKLNIRKRDFSLSMDDTSQFLIFLQEY